MLLTPSVEGLQRLLLVCESELNALGMTINDRKTVCLRIGPSYQVTCANLVTLSGKQLEWVREVRYLGVNIVSSCKFKCSFDSTKKSFFRCFNSVYGRIGKAASEEVILSLVKAKCIPVLAYGLDVCPLILSDIRSLDFTVTRILMKIFGTYDKDIIFHCQSYFRFPSVPDIIKRRKIAFLQKYIHLENTICKLFCEVCESQLNDLLKEVD